MLRQLINEKRINYEKAVAGGSTEKVSLSLLREMKRWLCRNDLFYLCCLTGNDKIAQYKEFYEPFCDEVSLMNWEVVKLMFHKPSEGMIPIEKIEEELLLQRLYLCYRTFYKTTIISKVHSLQLLLNFPNIHIVLCHNKQINASDNLTAIKNMFLTTELKRLFPEYIPRSKEWGNMSGFSGANRTDKGRSEENIEAAGVDTEITGRHYQIAKKNDLVTEKSVTTEDQLKKTDDWDERFNKGNFDDPQYPLQDYEGTRYHFADIYSKLKNNPKIKLIEIPIIKDGNIIHPERFTKDGVEGLKSDMWVFNCQMMLKPEDPAKMQFKQDMLGYFTEAPQFLTNYLLVDPASARKKRSDYTVMLVVGLDWEGKRYIVDGIRDKLNPKQRIDAALDLAVKWVVRACGWESVGFQTTDCYYLEEARRKQNLHFTIEEVKSHTVSKEDRIRSLVPEYAQHKWFWPQKGGVVKQSSFDGKNYDLTEAMEYEFIQFPLCEHDDLLDTMTFINRISTILPEKREITQDRQGMTFGEYSAIKDDRETALRRDPWKRLQSGVLV